MKSKRTLIYALGVLILALSVYFLDYKKQEKHEVQKDTESQILKFNPEQINLLEITKKDEKIVLHKSEKGWALIEPIQEKADNDQIEELIKSVVDERILALAKEAPQLGENDLAEFGLDHALATFNFKNNLGQSKKIAVGTQKNFEGNAFIRVDSENKIYVANAIWFNKAENKLLFYREKRLYRLPLADVISIKVSSLQDNFELKRNQNTWVSTRPDSPLDQNKVRETLRTMAESTIQDFVFDGEPSASLIASKGLTQKPLVHIELATAESEWAVDINIHEADNAVFALTDKPTRLVKLEPSTWEFFGNLSLDMLRDRVSITRFNLEQVGKAYFKYHGQDYSFAKTGGQWATIGGTPAAFTSEKFEQALKKIHDLEISEFIEKKQVDQFRGSEMIILKSDGDNLVFQLNWGPEFKIKKNGKEKDYFYARTQISASIFAIEKARIEKIGLDQIFFKSENGEGVKQ